MNTAHLQLAAQYAQENLAPFLRLAWPQLNPGTPLVWGWHIDAMCEHLEAVTKGHIDQLLITIPPGYTKTTSVTECWPSWEWLQFPHYRYLCASHSHSLANQGNDRRRDLIGSDWYEEAFKPDFAITKSGTEFLGNDSRGWMKPVSVGARLVTGFHGDRLITDDPLDASGVWGAELEKHVKWYTDVFRSRKRDGHAEVVIMQMLHNLDLANHLLSEGGWTHLCLPERCVENRRCTTSWQVPYHFFDSKNPTPEIIEEKGSPRARQKQDPQEVVFTDPRAHNEVLCPERRNDVQVTAEWSTLSNSVIAAQRQQDPRVGEGAIFPLTCWRFWHHSPAKAEEYGVYPRPDSFDTFIGAWDTTMDAGKSSDFTAGLIAGIRGAELFVLEIVNERMDVVQLENAIVDLATRYPSCKRWLIEKANIGPATVRRLRHLIMGIRTVSHRNEKKEARADAVSPLPRAGQVYFPHQTAVSFPVQSALDQLADFPRGRNDDVVDVLVYCLRWHMEHGAALSSRGLPFEPDHTKKISREEAIIAAVPGALGKHLEVPLAMRRMQKELTKAHRRDDRERRRAVKKDGPPKRIRWNSGGDGKPVEER